MAQPSLTADNGAKYILNQNITWGGNNFITADSTKDTLSDPVVFEITSGANAFRAQTFIGIEYKAIASDSNSSDFRMELQSRVCANPVTSTGCPTQWLTHRFRTIYDTAHFYDIINVPKVPNDTTQFGNYTLIPTGNQIRVRLVPGGKSTRWAFLKLVGY